MAKKKESPMKNMIKETMQELKDDHFPKDPDLSAEELTGPERFAKTQKQKDEVIIDSLLAPISGKVGYFLKLKKELRPNEWMIMKTIENEWRQWADVESAVMDIVREQTKYSPQKWGSGMYRIEYACKGGMRGDNYDPVDIAINAEEEFVTLPQNGGIHQPVDPAVSITSTLDLVTQLMNAVRGVVPTPQNPADIQNQMATAFKEGMSLKVGEGNNSSAMMATMMTGMMGIIQAMMTRPTETPRVVNPSDDFGKMLGVMKDFGVLGKTETQKPQTLVDMVKELQVLGIDLLKKDDPLDQITKLKQIAGIAADFMGMGGTTERPSIFEKLVDSLGPALPTIISNIKASSDNAVKVQELAGQNIERARVTMRQPGQPVQPISPEDQTTYSKMNGGETTNGGAGTAMNPQQQQMVTQFFNSLYESAKTDNKMFYPVIYTSLLQDAQGQELVQGIANQTKTSMDLIQLLQQHGGDRFKSSDFIMRHLTRYVNGFVLWVQKLASPAEEAPASNPTGDFEVKCSACQTVYGYATQQEFQNDPNKVCGTTLDDGKVCQGTMEPMVSV